MSETEHRRRFALTDGERHLLVLLLMRSIEEHSALPDDQRWPPELATMRALLERFSL